MTYRFFIALSILTVLVSTPLAADCWLDCDEEEQAAYAACDAIADPVLHAECVAWVFSDHITCLDACETGDDYQPTPGPWWPVSLNQGRCSVDGPGGLPLSPSVSSSPSGSADEPGKPVAVPSVGPDAQGMLETESVPEALHLLARALVRSLQVETVPLPEQERSDWQAVALLRPRMAAAGGLFEEQALR